MCNEFAMHAVLATARLCVCERERERERELAYTMNIMVYTKYHILKTYVRHVRMSLVYDI